MRALISVLTYCLLAGYSARATKHGTIGYGINMYHPWCCTACYDSLAAVHLNCTTFGPSSDSGGMNMKFRKRMDMDMDMTGSTSDACYASNLPYQQTLAYCVKTHCDAERVSYTKQNRCFEKLAAGGKPVPSLQDSLPRITPTEQLSEDAMWLNKTMLVNEEYWRSDRGTIEAFERSEEWHVRFSIILFTVSVGIPCLCGLWAYLSSKWGQHILNVPLVAFLCSNYGLPALQKTRHSQPLPYNIGYVPTRAMASWIIVYVILNIIFNAVPFYSVQPNTWFSNQNQEMAAYIGNRAGVLSFANMAIAILFSSRNNPLAYLSNWSYTSFLTFHRWVMRIAILQAVVHSIVYTADYCYYMGSSSQYAAEAAKPYWWWGIIATTAMALMAGFSALPLRRFAYEIFLGTHIVLGIFALIGCWYHIIERYQKKWGYEVWLYIAFAFWSYDRLVRLLRLVYFSILEPSWATAEMVAGTDVVSLKVYPGREWTGHPDSHTFLYFPTLGRFWENHPVTIADWAAPSHVVGAQRGKDDDDQSASSTDIASSNVKALSTKVSEKPASYSSHHQAPFYVRCYFRAHSGMTAKLHRTLASPSLSSTTIASRIPVLTEGPYGSHTVAHASLKSAEKVLCIAGGIGITWANGFVKQFSLDRLKQKQLRPISASQPPLLPRCRHFTLAWSVREEGLLNHFQKHELPDLTTPGGLDDGSLTYRFWLTGQEATTASENKTMTRTNDAERKEVELVIGRRMNVDQLLDAFLEPPNRRTSHAVLVCGPGGLADAVRASVVRHVKHGCYIVHLMEESFAW